MLPRLGDARKNQSAQRNLERFRGGIRAHPLNHPARLAILNELPGAPGIRAVHVATRIGLSFRATTYHLRRLGDWGLVCRTGGWLYQLTPEGQAVKRRSAWMQSAPIGSILKAVRHRTAGVTIEGLAKAVKLNLATTTDHVLRLEHADLVALWWGGKTVYVYLTGDGRDFVQRMDEMASPPQALQSADAQPSSSRQKTDAEQAGEAHAS